MTSVELRESLRDGQLAAGRALGIDALSGAVSGVVTDLQTLGRAPVRIERRYDSSCATGALGIGWSLAIDDRAVELATEGRHSIQVGSSVVELERRGGVIARLEVRVAGTPVCVRVFEHDGGRLVRVRDPRERVLEQYEYDGRLLVSGRIGEVARRYFEYDDRGRRARCVRTWSATTRFDRALTHTRDATVIDDGVGETWIVRRSPHRRLIDPELRESELVIATGARAGARAEVAFDVDGRVGSIRAGGGALVTRTDAIGRVVAVASASGDRIRWDHEGPRVRAVLERGGRVVSWLEAAADEPTRVHELVDEQRGRRVTARFDGDAELECVESGGATLLIDRDGEGRARAVSCADAALRMVRDRAGALRTIELPDERAIASADAWRFALGGIDGEVVRQVLRWSPEAARAVLDGGTPPPGPDGIPGDALSQHVAAVLSHARALGLRGG